MKFLIQFLALLPYFLGMGLLFRRVLRKITDAELPSDCGFLLITGPFFAGYLTMTWNLLFPMYDVFSYSLFVLGCFAVFLYREDLEKSWPQIASIAAWFFVLAVFGMRVDISSDSSGYHLPGIIWTKTETLPIGIVNLNNALPFNSLLYSVNAAAKLPFLGFEAPFLLNAWITAGFFVFCQARLFAGKLSKSAEWFLALLLLSFAPLTVFLNNNLGSPSMEIGTTLFTILPLYFTLRSFEEKNWKGALAAAFCLALIAVMIRLSTAPVLALAPACYAFRAWREDWRSKLAFAKTAVIVSALFLLPWLTRGILSSGCLAYPAHYTCLRFLPWEGSEIALDVATSSAAWVRNPGVPSFIVLKDWNWLHTWIPLTWGFGVVKLAALLLTCAVVLGLLTRKRLRIDAMFFFTFFYLFAFAFWFFALPDARYGYGFFLSVGALFCSIGFTALRERPGLSRALPWMIPLFLFAVTGFKAYRHASGAEAPLSYSDWPKFAQVEFETVKLPPEGIPIFIPTTPNQNCWDRIPCTRRLMPGLNARRTAGGRLIFTLEPKDQ